MDVPISVISHSSYECERKIYLKTSDYLPEAYIYFNWKTKAI